MYKAVGNDPPDQNAKDHIKSILSVNKYFHDEGLRIILNHYSVTFTHCIDSVSAIRFIDHIWWSFQLDQDHETQANRNIPEAEISKSKLTFGC